MGPFPLPELLVTKRREPWKKTGVGAIPLHRLCFFPVSLNPVPASSPPAILLPFASPEIVSGDTWKIYIKAGSRGANMPFFGSTVAQAGAAIAYSTLKFIVRIRDDPGRFGEPAVFPLIFNPRASVALPPPGLFPEKAPGPIMIRIRPGSEDGRSFFDP